MYDVGRKRAILYGLFIGIGTMLGFGVILGVLWYGGYLVLDSKLSVGDLSSFVMYTMTLTVSALSAGGTINVFITAIGVSEKLFEIMD